MMDIADALEIVLALAKAELDNSREELSAAQIAEKEDAINIVTDMAVNQFGDD